MITQQQEEGAAPDLLRGRPILRVLLGSAEELASARATIKFAYTGEVQADSIREALGVLRQAAHLQVEGCAAACLERIKTLLPQAQDAAGHAPVVPPVLELYACERLWPEAVEEPRFASVLEAAKPLLVSHFGDTLAALNRPVLREQLLTLPAVALEALLESDDFGTDTEDSVMLLLATWMRENRGRTDSAARERLCRLVRLVQLSRQYATFVLPLLAADFASSCKVNNPGWFSTSCANAALISAYVAAASRYERAEMLEDIADVSKQSPWFSTRARRRCIPEAGLDFRWSLDKEKLREVLDKLQPDGEVFVPCPVDTASGHIMARGFRFTPELCCARGEDSSIYLSCQLPEAYLLPGSHLLDVKHGPVVDISARLFINRWRGGVQGTPNVRFAEDDLMHLGGQRRGMDISLRELAASDGPLAAWFEYLRHGRITGKLTLLQAVASWDEGEEAGDGRSERSDEGDE
ncbi:hypothetical protein GPECTOR_6g904 [Gonium pectorale]|uniref:BACK domain-containing protein n=1 Tax=Gonium pectorale TaxID=33097 RepID=A0A150GW08_GONPE|nr:hypothetical protein GPECTOR_6g904 [Gonium pectorale]|eukprot:KXZ53984.1 hypothetical protein GPECTOR_6g904 [Gonium pectorale]